VRQGKNKAGCQYGRPAEQVVEVEKTGSWRGCVSARDSFSVLTLEGDGEGDRGYRNGIPWPPVLKPSEKTMLPDLHVGARAEGGVQ